MRLPTPPGAVVGAVAGEVLAERMDQLGRRDTAGLSPPAVTSEVLGDRIDQIGRRDTVRG